MDVTIRQADARDYEAATLLYNALDVLHATLYPTIFREPKGPSRTREAFEAKLADPMKTVFVATCMGELCGLADAHEEAMPDFPIFIPARFAQIDNFIVAEHFRRRGIAGRMLAAIREWAAAREIEKIQLSVYSMNADALAFYRSAGFAPLRERLELRS